MRRSCPLSIDTHRHARSNSALVRRRAKPEPFARAVALALAFALASAAIVAACASRSGAPDADRVLDASSDLAADVAPALPDWNAPGRDVMDIEDVSYPDVPPW